MTEAYVVQADVEQRLEALHLAVLSLREAIVGKVTVVDTGNMISNKVPGWNVVMAVVTEKYGDVTLNRSHHPRFVFTRHVAMYLLRELAKMSYPEIGRLFNKHHTTVLHGVEKIKDMKFIDPKINAEIEELERKLRA